MPKHTPCFPRCGPNYEAWTEYAYPGEERDLVHSAGEKKRALEEAAEDTEECRKKLKILVGKQTKLFDEYNREKDDFVQIRNRCVRRQQTWERYLAKLKKLTDLPKEEKSAKRASPKQAALKPPKRASPKRAASSKSPDPAAVPAASALGLATVASALGQATAPACCRQEGALLPRA